jgi:hypothetical protein
MLITTRNQIKNRAKYMMDELIKTHYFQSFGHNGAVRKVIQHWVQARQGEMNPAEKPRGP